MTVLWAAACLLLAIALYGCSSILLAEGATSKRGAVRAPTWWAGTALQGLAFVAAFAARQHLSLLLVQAASAASLVVTTLIGAALGRWKLTRADIAWICVLVLGVVAIAAVASGGGGHPLGLIMALTSIASLIAAIVVVRVFANPLLFGVGAGLAFGTAAVMSRPLVSSLSDRSGHAATLAPLLILLAGVLVGQTCLTTALASGRVAGPVAAMYVVETVLPGFAGIVWLGDGLRTNGVWAALLGIILATFSAQRLAGHGYRQSAGDFPVAPAQDGPV